MAVLLAIVLKSVLIAGLTLLLLHIFRARSAAERSCIAHVGLFALVMMAVAPLVLPGLSIQLPSLLSQTSSLAAIPADAATVRSGVQGAGQPALAAVHPAAPSSVVSLSAMITALYAVPAAILLLITSLALLRLVALRARADVLVDGHWLSALARAQRRMGFKHGTALLTSNELASPISWGLLRPVILLNTRAVQATGEAEAILAHEIAHVAGMDWIKLLLARVATALFWFNPLVWALARESHQLREEAADDSVLAADIVDTDYAELLVGVARHDCPGLLLGAHGVAPSKKSLARRVARVLNSELVRGPAARTFALGVLAAAVAVVTPLAVLNVTAATPAVAAPTISGLATLAKRRGRVDLASAVPTDLPHLIAQGVSTSVTAASAAMLPTVVKPAEPIRAVASSGASVQNVNGVIMAQSANGATVTVFPPDSSGRRRTVARAADGTMAETYIDGDDGPGRHRDGKTLRGDRAIDTAIEMRVLGVTPEFVAAMRSASGALRSADLDDIVQMKAVGVTPDYARAMASTGYNLSADELTQARAVGLDPEYVRAIRATGSRPDFDKLVELRSMGVTPGEVTRVRNSGGFERRKTGFLVRLPTQAPAPPQPPDAARG